LAATKEEDVAMDPEEFTQSTGCLPDPLVCYNDPLSFLV
jgi:hypothetical protein